MQNNFILNNYAKNKLIVCKNFNIAYWLIF